MALLKTIKKAFEDSIKDNYEVSFNDVVYKIKKIEKNIIYVQNEGK